MRRLLKIARFAGNESADQDADNFDFRTEARAAKDRGIIINAMFAGNREQAIVEHWPEVARGGAGTFSAIDPAICATCSSEWVRALRACGINRSSGQRSTLSGNCRSIAISIETGQNGC